ncbi:hypothetical protein LJK87_06020 [Paenibacillus sp. P25]|nr:hypothetical protein LJK87_06020 [Paenibacillus sp. P25]
MNFYSPPLPEEDEEKSTFFVPSFSSILEIHEIGEREGERMYKIKVMLVEDDPFWQQTLAADLNELEDIEVVYTAATKEEACGAAETGISTSF